MTSPVPVLASFNQNGQAPASTRNTQRDLMNQTKQLQEMQMTLTAVPQAAEDAGRTVSSRRSRTS